MNILVACEESQTVTIELRKKGHNAFSCDILKCSGNHPEWHINGDCLPLLDGMCKFKTQDGEEHEIENTWDMILAFPPCTDLAVSGARHFLVKRISGVQEKSIEFFCQFLDVNCEKVCIENPVNIISGSYVKEYFPHLCEKYDLPLKPTQHIQPYEFGDKARKKTCFWLKGLEPLKPTEIVEPELVTFTSKDGKIKTFSKDYGFPGAESGKRRSKTYPGVAKAIADQWG